MKNWLRIGQFAKRSGLTERALRLYETEGLLLSHQRGENGYRYYGEDQLERAQQIQQFRQMGFGLKEIRSLLQSHADLDVDRLQNFLLRRLTRIVGETKSLSTQTELIHKILSSLKSKKMGLSPQQRRYIMGQFDQISVVITGIRELKATADHIREALLSAGQDVPILQWSQSLTCPRPKPHILIVPEEDLNHPSIRKISPDIVVIQNISGFSSQLESQYLNLYSHSGPHMTTIFNADDRVSIELAAHNKIRQGRIFYYSKNEGLQDQIREIGGVVSNGEKIQIFAREKTDLKLKRLLPFDEETALLASLAAVLEFGLKVPEAVEVLTNGHQAKPASES